MPKTVESATPVLFLVVAVALVDDEGRVLVQRRPAGKSMAGLWEFPGGKVETGEVPEAALVRELGEELGVIVNPADLQAAAFASEPLGGRHLLLLLYICRQWEGTPTALHAEELLWCTPDALYDLQMPPADLPLIGLLKALM
jgi:8-oxo-dGTP diphosphatase